MGGTSKAWRFVRGVWLLSAVVVCFGAFLCFLPTELAVSTALTPAHSPPLDRATDDGYLAVFQEEASGAHKDPVHADLLTMLVLAVSSFFGLSVGWLLTNTQWQGALWSLGVVGPSLASACEESTLPRRVVDVGLSALLSQGAQEQS
jgi:hypothetical protein